MTAIKEKEFVSNLYKISDSMNSWKKENAIKEFNKLAKKIDEKKIFEYISNLLNNNINKYHWFNFRKLVEKNCWIWDYTNMLDNDLYLLNYDETVNWIHLKSWEISYNWKNFVITLYNKVINDGMIITTKNSIKIVIPNDFNLNNINVKDRLILENFMKWIDNHIWDWIFFIKEDWWTEIIKNINDFINYLDKYDFINEDKKTNEVINITVPLIRIFNDYNTEIFDIMVALLIWINNYKNYLNNFMKNPEEIIKKILNNYDYLLWNFYPTILNWHIWLESNRKSELIVYYSRKKVNLFFNLFDQVELTYNKINELDFLDEEEKNTLLNFEKISNIINNWNMSLWYNVKWNFEDKQIEYILSGNNAVKTWFYFNFWKIQYWKDKTWVDTINIQLNNYLIDSSNSYKKMWENNIELSRYFNIKEELTKIWIDKIIEKSKEIFWNWIIVTINWYEQQINSIDELINFLENAEDSLYNKWVIELYVPLILLNDNKKIWNELFLLVVAWINNFIDYYEELWEEQIELAIKNALYDTNILKKENNWILPFDSISIIELSKLNMFFANVNIQR